MSKKEINCIKNNWKVCQVFDNNMKNFINLDEIPAKDLRRLFLMQSGERI